MDETRECDHGAVNGTSVMQMSCGQDVDGFDHTAAASQWIFFVISLYRTGTLY